LTIENIHQNIPQ